MLNSTIFLNAESGRGQMEASNLSKLKTGSFPKVFEKRACEGCKLKMEIKFNKKF